MRHLLWGIAVGAVALTGAVATVWAQALPVSEIPADFVQQVDEADLVEIYCLNTRWQSGEFFASLAVAETPLAAVRQQVESLEVTVSWPDLTAIKAEAESRLAAVCEAGTVDGAAAAAANVESYGAEVQALFAKLESELETKLSARGEQLKTEIQAVVEPEILSQIKSMEESISEKAADEANRVKAKLEQELAIGTYASVNEAELFVTARLPELEAEARRILQSFTESQKSSLKSFAESVVLEKAPPEKALMEQLGAELRALPGQITAGAKARLSEYDTYRQQAQAKRVELVLAYVDAKVEAAATELEASRDELAQLKQFDENAPTPEVLLASLRRDRDQLAGQLRAALANGDEMGFQEAISSFQEKWQSARERTEQAFATPQRICSLADIQFAAFKPQIADTTARIDSLMERCIGHYDQMCLKAMELSGRFTEMTAALDSVAADISQVEAWCDVSRASGELDERIVPLLKQIELAGQQLAVQGELLAAEKLTYDEWARQRAATMCAAQLQWADSGLREMERLYGSWQIRMSDCASGEATGAQCAVFTELADEIAGLDGQIAEVTERTAAFRSSCRNLSGDATAEEVWAEFSGYLDFFQGIDTRVREIHYRSAALKAPATVCEAGQPLVDALSRDLQRTYDEAARQVGRLVNLRSGCSAEATDAGCLAIVEADEQLAQLANQHQYFTKMFWEYDERCRVATGLRAEGLRATQEQLVGYIAELKKVAGGGDLLADRVEATVATAIDSLSE
jgi:hypothetical protein